MLTDRIDQKVTQGQKHRSVGAAHVTEDGTRARKMSYKAKKSNWEAMTIRTRKGAKTWTTSLCGRDQAQRCFRWVRPFEEGIIHREKIM